MKNFYYYSDKLDKDQNHVIHSMDCQELPSLLERTLIGLKVDFTEAKVAAKAIARERNFVNCAKCSNIELRLIDSKITKF